MFKDCPTDELKLCWWYEYSREGCRDSPLQSALFPSDFPEVNLYPEWPRTPYLSIPPADRRERLIRWEGGSKNYLRSLNLMPPSPTYIPPKVDKKKSLVDLKDTRVLERLLAAQRYLDTFWGFKLDGTMLRPKHRWPVQEISDACWVAPFRIDWQRSDSEILADFAAWLKEYRPKAFMSPIGDRGGGNSSRCAKAELKALGALRLLRHYKNWQDIPLEASIYEKQDSWMTAHQKAKERLKSFHP
jgi:hypothetical protein